MNIPNGVEVVLYQRELAKSYAKVLTDMGIQGAKNVQVFLYHGQGDFLVSSNAVVATNTLFSCAEPNNGNILQNTETGASMCHGSLIVNNYINSVGGGASATVESGLSSGRNLALTTFTYKARTLVTAGDGNINTFSPGAPGVSYYPYMDQFNNVMFNYLRLRVNQTIAGTIAAMTEWYFTGVIVRYSL